MPDLLPPRYTAWLRSGARRSPWKAIATRDTADEARATLDAFLRAYPVQHCDTCVLPEGRRP